MENLATTPVDAYLSWDLGEIKAASLMRWVKSAGVNGFVLSSTTRSLISLPKLQMTI
jgi:hypothetical protein